MLLLAYFLTLKTNNAAVPCDICKCDSVGKATCSFEWERQLYTQAGEQQRDSNYRAGIHGCFKWRPC